MGFLVEGSCGRGGFSAEGAASAAGCLLCLQELLVLPLSSFEEDISILHYGIGHQKKTSRREASSVNYDGVVDSEVVSDYRIQLLEKRTYLYTKTTVLEIGVWRTSFE